MIAAQMAKLPGPLQRIINNSMLFKNINWSGSREQYDDLKTTHNLKAGEDRVHTFDVNDAEVVSSKALGTGDKHRIMLDLDVPAFLIESSTPGHSHLYIDVQLTWDEYQPLLKALADARVIERGYANVSIARQQTFLRLPWIKKGFERFRGSLHQVEEFLAS